MDTQHCETAVRQARSTDAETLSKRDDRFLWDQFPEPRGWTLRWDGGALSEADPQPNGRAPSVELR